MPNNPEDTTTSSNSPESNSLQAVLSAESAAANPQIDKAKLQSVQNKPGTNPEANPYFDQQVLPGQIVGYNIPTNQTVEIPIIKPDKLHKPSKKFFRTIVAVFGALVILAILGGLVLVALKITSS